MKLIDEKGKLFGIINVIDLAIILVVLALITGIMVKLGSSTDRTESEQTKTFYVTVLCKGVEGKVAENLKKGDQIVYSNLYVNGFIESAEKAPAKKTVVLEDGSVKKVVMPDLADVTVLLKVVYDRTDDLIMLGKYQVNIGKKLVVKTHRVEVDGIVQDIVEK